MEHLRPAMPLRLPKSRQVSITNYELRIMNLKKKKGCIALSGNAALFFVPTELRSYLRRPRALTIAR